MRDQWIIRRMGWGVAAGGAYGLWLVCAHLPGGLDGVRWPAAAAWTLAIMMGAGSVLAGAVATTALLSAAGARTPRRAALAAWIETFLWLPLLAWLVVNEFVYATTSEVLGAGALLLLWHNTAAVLQNAWAMGARYLVASGIIVLTALVVIQRLSSRSFRRRVPPRNSGKTLCAAGRMPVPLGRWGRAMVGGLVVLVALLAWETRGRPGEALIAVCRSAPPLRVFNFVQALSLERLRAPLPAGFGPAVITDEQYAATLGRPREPAPHVVYLLLESVPAKALHCYGYPKPDITPNLDRLAADGALFRHCVAPSSFSSCSVVSLATSLYMLRGNRFDYFSNMTFPFMSLPRALKLAGYELALFSSGNESFDNINRFCRPADFDRYFSHDTCGIPQPDCMRMDDKFAVGEFEKWIAGRDDPRPFYCGFYLQSPHFNYEVPEPWASHYQPVPPLFSSGDGILHIPADVLPKLRNQYDNALRYADYWVGRIVEALGKTGALDRTIIVATGDHGEAFMEHGLARHGVHTWEEMIHTPLIVWLGPEIRAASRQPLPSVVTSTVSGIDIAPTVAGLVGIRSYPGWQGVNVLDPGYRDRDRPVFSMTQYTRWQETVCLDKLKYLYDLTEAREYLFDLKADPDERRNLASEKPDLAAAMRRLLAGWHTHQLSYYGVPNRDVYPGRYEP
ncbi:MAG TPA: sulfatase, partial [Phycisphaerae bacterium]|nr:sulfatase [Phycisphaerae bacterium]